MRKVVIAAAAALAVGGARAQSTTAELKAALDQAMKTIQDLQARVKALEEQQQQKAQAAAKPAAAASAPAVAGAPTIAPGSTAVEGAPEADQARVEIYGHAMADAIYDFK